MFLLGRRAYRTSKAVGISQMFLGKHVYRTTQRRHNRYPPRAYVGDNDCVYALSSNTRARPTPFEAYLPPYPCDKHDFEKQTLIPHVSQICNMTPSLNIPNQKSPKPEPFPRPDTKKKKSIPHPTIFFQVVLFPIGFWTFLCFVYLYRPPYTE